MKKLIVSSILVVFGLVPTLALSGTKDYRVDLDDDGSREIITVKDKSGDEVYSEVSVFSSDKKYLDGFLVPGSITDIQFASLNKNGGKHLSILSIDGAHFDNIVVYEYKNAGLREIFADGSGCGIRTDFKTKSPTIAIGRPDLGEDWTYADEPLWANYVWDGKWFVFDKGSSSIVWEKEKEMFERREGKEGFKLKH